MVPTSEDRIPFGRVFVDVARATAPFALLTICAAPAVFCLIGIPILFRLIGALYLRLLGRRSAELPTWRIGVLGLPLLAGPLLSMIVAVGLVAPSFGQPLSTLIPPLAAMLVGAALSPLYAAPFEAIESGTGFIASLLASGSRSAREPIGLTLGRGALLGLVSALPWFVPMILSSLGVRELWPITFLGLAMAASLVLSLAIVAHGWSEGRERFGAARTRVSPRPRPTTYTRATHGRLAGSLVLAFAPASILGVVLAIALLTPTAAGTLLANGGPSDPLHSFASLAPHAAIVLDETGGLRVSSPRDDVWRVETADGGGAGEIRLARGHEHHAFVHRVAESAPWSLCVPRERGGTLCTSFDDRGVRVDDGPGARIATRLGVVGTAILALYACALSALVFLQLRRLGVAAGLDAPEMRRSHGVAAVIATLHASSDTHVRRGALVVRGAAHLDLGEGGTLHLAEGPHALLVAETAPKTLEGAAITVIASLPAGHGSPFRDASASLPRDAKLVFGALGHAREVFVEHTARRNVGMALPLVFVALGLCLAVLANL